MTRRDRAALVLALECLRCMGSSEGGAWRDGACTRVVVYARDALRYTPVGLAIAARLSEHAPRLTYPEYRMLRARLALTLRALIRADAGDVGKYERIVSCTKHGRIGRTVFPDIRMSCNQCSSEWRERDRWSKASGDAYEWGGRVFEMPLPLWQQAPATGTATRPAGLNRR